MPMLSDVYRICQKHFLAQIYVSFVKPGTQIDSTYYRDELQLLRGIRRIAYDAYIFQRDSALAHRARQTVKLLCLETPEFIASDMWPPDCVNLNLVDYHI